MSMERKEPLFKNPIESDSGLSIDDLNKYLPAIHKIEDLSMTANQMRDGLFLGLAIDGLKKIPNDSIDIIITEPPESPLEDINNTKKPITIQKYFEWNKNWLRESYRILKQTGSIYLICGWKHSAMYQSLLNSLFNTNPKYIFISGQIYYEKNINNNEFIIAKQIHTLPNSNFLYFFEYSPFINLFKNKNFNIIFDEVSSHHVNFSNFSQKYGNIRYSDILFKNMNKI